MTNNEYSMFKLRSQKEAYNNRISLHTSDYWLPAPFQNVIHTLYKALTTECVGIFHTNFSLP